MIAARDSQGAKSKIGKTVLDIEVDDVNDNAPDLYANIIVKSINQTGKLSWVTVSDWDWIGNWVERAASKTSCDFGLHFSMIKFSIMALNNTF